MGTFGTEISGNDEYLDLEIEFFELYNEGLEVSTISNKIIQKHNESLNSDEDSNNFWLALADFQWQCKALDEDVLNKINDVIESESDLKLWEELGSDQEDIEERRIELNKFLAKISTPVKRAKRRVKKKFFDSVFKKGDCLVFELTNGNYGAALVIDDEYQTELGLNTIVVADISKKDIPKINDLKTAKVQYFYSGNSEDAKPFICKFYATHYDMEKSEIEIIKLGNVELKPCEYRVRMGASWTVLRDWNKINDFKESFEIDEMSMFIKESSLWSRLRFWL